MCGRYTLTSPIEGIRALFDIEERPNVQPRYNIAPTQSVPAVRLGEDGRRHIALLRWGLVPFWAEDESIGNRLINARGESVAGKPAFRAAFRSRRCLIPANGFYEWKSEKGVKQPYLITLGEDRLFAFAGLWESWRRGEEGAPLESFTIVTTEADPRIAHIHPRMPVVLSPDSHALWLDPESSSEGLQGLLKPWDGEDLEFRRVSRSVNNVANDDASLIASLDSHGDDSTPGAQRSLF